MTTMVDRQAPHTTAPVPAVEGLHHWFQTLLAELSETDLSLRQAVPSGDDATRAILQRVQDRLEQAQRERAGHRYTAAHDSIAAAYRILREELRPHLAARLKRETSPAVRERLTAWVDVLDDLFESEAA